MGLKRIAKRALREMAGIRTPAPFVPDGEGGEGSEVLAHLATRRSVKPRHLMAPGPNPDQLAAILAIGMRTPDHGKLAPWRFVIIPAERRAAFVALLDAAAEYAHPGRGALAARSNRLFATQAPTLVAVLSAPEHSAKVPVWEQELSAGAACMNILHAAHAMGFAGSWITDWPAFDPHVLAGLGGRTGDRIAGFLYIGTASEPPEERARPRPAEVVREWRG